MSVLDNGVKKPNQKRRKDRQTCKAKECPGSIKRGNRGSKEEKSEGTDEKGKRRKG